MHPDLDSTSEIRRSARRRSRAGAVAAALLWVLVLAGSSEARAAYEVSGVAFADRSEAGGRSLEIKGLGLHRYRVFIKLYAMALYVDPAAEPQTRTAAQVIEADAPKRLELQTFLSIPARMFRRMTRERIARNVTPAEYAALEPSIEALNALYEDVEPGDRYAITYVPGVGTELTKNGIARGVVAGEPFARAMFGIWLGEEPFDRKLRSKLLEDVK